MGVVGVGVDAEVEGGGYDALICDLDGVVYRGSERVAYAVESLALAAGRGLPVLFASNNDTRTAEQMAWRVCELGLTIEPSQVVTAPQALAALIRERHAAGTKVAVCGAPALEQALLAAELVPCALDSGALILAQGLDPELRWRELGAVARAIDAAEHWYTTNLDPAVIRETGRLPGNGALVGVLSAMTSRRPVLAGKPSPHMLLAAAALAGARRPLMIGDQLETDVAAARAAGMASLLVLTGICSAAEAEAAEAGVRPTHVAPDLRVLEQLAGAR